MQRPQFRQQIIVSGTWALVKSGEKQTVLRQLEKLKSAGLGDGLTKGTRGEKHQG